MNDITNKKSKLVFDMRIVRSLLKKNNGDPKFCPYCGTLLKDGCDCHKNIVIDVKPLRGSENVSIAVFMNNESFQNDFKEVAAEFKAKDEARLKGALERPEAAD